MRIVALGRVLDLDRTAVMGILNVTPDSFSDGGRWLDPEAAVAHAVEMADAGADIIDIGGESTRPGADPVGEDEELARVLPVIDALASRGGAWLSIDSRKPAVARAAVERGAAIINDTSGEASSVAMDQVAAATEAAIIVMHSRGTPKTMTKLAAYSDVVSEVRTYLAERAARLERLGLPREGICVDPGFGFAKSAAHSLTLLRRLDELVVLGYPVVAGTSRKSFIGDVLGLPADDRLEGTIATLSWAVAQGARIVRTHDVEPVLRAVRMTEAIAHSK